MINKQINRRNLLKYSVLTYLIFWILLGITGLIISLKAPQVIQDLMKNICAWSPTFSILILFKILYPGISLKEYLKIHFCIKLKIQALALPFLLQTLILILTISVYLIFNQKSIFSLPLISVSAILPALLITLTAGATGEELGWRGFMLQEIQKKYNPLISSLIIGFTWGVWHLPLWFLSGYKGMDIIIYILLFMTSILSFSILITYFYNIGKNILIAIWMHFLFNFSLKLVQIDLLQLLGYNAFFLSIAAVTVVIFKRKFFLKNQ
jgi:membrane protease YdiL (CAAX protease family)